MLLNRLLASVDRYPTKLAVADEKLELTYERLRLLSGVFARMVTQRCQTETVGICLPACAAFAPVFYGCRWAKKVAVPLNFLLNPEELKKVIESAGFDTIFTVRFFEKQLAPLGKQIVYVDDELAALKAKAEKVAWLPAVVKKMLAPKPPAVPEYKPDELAVLIYTSGTSGTPKGVMLTEGNLCTNADECILKAKMHPDEKFLGVLPMFHSFGLTALCVAPLTIGGTGYYLARFSPAGAVKLIQEHQIAVFLGVPGMYAAMSRLKSADADALKSLQLAISGGEALPGAIADQFRERYGVEILQGYGLTETSPVIALNTPWDHQPGSVGKPLPSFALRIVHDLANDDAVGDHDANLDATRPGELYVKGPCVTPGYYRNPEATKAAFSDDGWFKTGDLATIDPEGYITIRGRRKELIIVSGENVYPGEVEQVLVQHPAIASAAVIGKKDDLRGELPVAFVTLNEGQSATASDIRDFCRDRLAAYKVPHEVRIEAELPVGPTGKVLKRQLLDRV